MPGRLRDRGTLSDKAQGCCTKCCENCCRCALPTKILSISICALIAVTLLAWFFGASLAGPGGPNLIQPEGTRLCSSRTVDNTTGQATGGDFTLPLSNHNIYAWYLANTGIFVMLMVASSCVCCGSFVGLCCGDFPRAVKIISIIGWILFILGFSIFTLWVVLGVFLLITYSSTAFIKSSVCRNLAIYLFIIFIYYIVLVLAFVVSCIWKSWTTATTPKTRPSASKV